MSCARFFFKFSHHGEYSAFHRLIHFLPQSDFTVDATLPLKRFIPQRAHYRAECFWRKRKENFFWEQSRKLGMKCVHYLYPENTWFDPPERKGDPALIITAHQPVESLKSRWGSKGMEQMQAAISRASAIVTVGPKEVDFLAEKAPNAKVTFIPHGIDTHWFRPPDLLESDSVKESMRDFLTMGSWLRDFGVWASVVEEAAKKKLGFRFSIRAAGREFETALGSLSPSARNSVFVLNRMSDFELRQCYWGHRGVFLPLKSATANNAVLESLACGIPLITTDLAATKAYTQGSVITFANEDISGICDGLGRLKEPEFAKRLSEKGLLQADNNLSWGEILRQYKMVEKQFSA